MGQAGKHGKLQARLVDLKEVALPLFDEPMHPRLKQYEHEHSKRWSALVEASDAFVFVSPEYNFGTPPALVNAIDYLLQEWKYKACGFVSYGGVSAGTRAMQMSKQLVTTVGMMPIPEAVNIPMVGKLIDGDGRFNGEQQEKAALVMLDELDKWTTALRPLRAVR